MLPQKTAPNEEFRERRYSLRPLRRGVEEAGVFRLIDEFKIRTQVAGIEASSNPPLRKARLILRVARRLRGAADRLGQHGRRSFVEGDALRGARMSEATQRLYEAHAEVRARAGAALAGGPGFPRREGSRKVT